MIINMRLIGYLFCFLLINFSTMADDKSSGFDSANPSYQISFPKDHGPHKNFRIEWWYFTANLKSETINDLGIQWTLFKSNLIPTSLKKPRKLNGFWMAHSALTTKNVHYFDERFAREDSGQAGVTQKPFKAWIDNWAITGDDKMQRIQLVSSSNNFSISLKFSTNNSPILQGNNGYSKKSEQGAASHYYSQPFYNVSGWVTLNGKRHFVDGVGWLDREWSSDLLSKNQLGWDWFSLHLDNGQKVMLFRVRNNKGSDFLSGSWTNQDGSKKLLDTTKIELKEIDYSEVKGKRVPTKWKISFLGSKPFTINTKVLNHGAWMDTSFPYWEGPISFDGDLSGVGYLEMTGY